MPIIIRPSEILSGGGFPALDQDSAFNVHNDALFRGALILLSNS